MAVSDSTNSSEGDGAIARLPALIEAVLEELGAGERSGARLRALVTAEGAASVAAAAGPKWTVRGSVGMGIPADVPWIAVFPSGEASAASAQTGFYVVFLFAADGSAAYLSLNQGTEEVRGGLAPIAKRALDLRVAAELTGREGDAIDLRSNTARARKYEAGSAYAFRYQAGGVPEAAVLKADLAEFLLGLEQALSSGLSFGPKMEPLHLILKWSADIEAQTVSLHRDKAAERKSVWWGRLGRGSPINAARLKLLQDQIASDIPTYAFLYGGSETVRTRVREITLDPEDVDEERLPGYYEAASGNLFLRLSDFEDLEEGWLQSHTVLASAPDPSKTRGALGNQTNPLYVYELFVPSKAERKARRATTTLSMRWLEETTLWPASDLEELTDAVMTRGQTILGGPPGTGKTWVVEHLARYLTQDQPLQRRTIQFHPSYGYEDFVEGLRPVVEDGMLKFRPEPGAVKQLVADMDGTRSTHMLVIDELNRANVPLVFGELMYLLEYRDRPINLQYSTDFQLPESLKIVATMNTADRSVRSIDVALRRRFDIFECRADPSILNAYYETSGRQTSVPGLVEGFTELNDELERLLDRHHAVGQAYFMKSEYGPSDLQRTWKRQIEPLIEGYFFDQPDVAESFVLQRFWPDI